MKYDLLLISSLNGAEPTDPSKLYVEKQADNIRYTVYFNGQAREGVIERNELDLTDDQFKTLDGNNLESWEKLKDRIISVTDKKGHTLDWYLIEADLSVREIVENFNDNLVEVLKEAANNGDIKTFLTPDVVSDILLTKLLVITSLIKGIQRLNKIPYLADHVELIYQYHEKTSDPGNFRPATEENRIITEGEIEKDIIIKTKSDKREETRKLFNQVISIENKLRQIYKEKLQSLKARGVASDYEMPTKDEIDMLYNALCMMIYAEETDHVNDSVFLLFVQPQCPVYKLITGFNLMGHFEKLNQLDMNFDARDRLYGELRMLRLIAPEKLHQKFNNDVFSMTKSKLKNIERDEKHAIIIIKRLADIQIFFLKQVQSSLAKIYDEQIAELKEKGPDQVEKDLISMRDQFRNYVVESDHVSLFSNEAPLPFYKRISETIILLKRLQKLTDPDLVTPGDKLAAQEKFKAVIEDRAILKKNREEMESIRPKIKKEQQSEAELTLQRMIMMVQYATSEMKDYLEALKQEAVVKALLGHGSDALEYYSSSTPLALK